MCFFSQKTSPKTANNVVKHKNQQAKRKDSPIDTHKYAKESCQDLSMWEDVYDLAGGNVAINRNSTSKNVFVTLFCSKSTI